MNYSCTRTRKRRVTAELFVNFLDKLIEEVMRKEYPLIESMIDTLGTLIKDYEDRYYRF